MTQQKRCGSSLQNVIDDLQEEQKYEVFTNIQM